MSEVFKIQCPGCKSTLKVPLNRAGQKGSCPKCKGSFWMNPPKEIEPKPQPKPQPQQRASTPPPPPQPKQQPKPQTKPQPAPLDELPSHADELHQDKRRMLAAVSMERDKYILVESYLMSYEEPVAIAVQRQFPFSIFSDIVLLTSHRLLIFNRFFTKIEMFDLDYIEFFDVTLKQGFFTSSLTIVGVDHSRKTVHKLVTEQALKVYRLCQDIETKARIARRQFELEENRSRTTTMQVNNVLGHPQSPQPQSGPTTFLSHREIANVGDEERDPYKSGQ